MIMPGNYSKRGQRQCGNIKITEPAPISLRFSSTHAALPAIGANVITYGDRRHWELP
jgi:hypothetical protein